MEILAKISNVWLMYLNDLNNRAVSPTYKKGFAPFWQKDLGLNEYKAKLGK